MPSVDWPSRPRTGITKFTNCRLIKGDEIVNEDLWISSVTGKIIRSQVAFYDFQATADHIVDLGGRLLAPGFLDVQLNGYGGFSFSQVPPDITDYVKGLHHMNQYLLTSGVTSYLPTLPSNYSHVYHHVLPYLGPSGAQRRPEDGAESLGAHVEGPFISPTKNGIHSVEVLRTAPHGIADMDACYGAHNLRRAGGPVTKITLAPEREGVLATIPALAARGIIVALGHSEATYEEACAALDGGASMITHLFNAMRPLHHRNPGMFGTLGKGEQHWRPYFGVIADGEHLHPTSVTIAWNAHPEGFILVTDAMHPAGLPDGVYEWTNGGRFVKKGSHLTLEGTERMAGCTIPLIDCISNFLNWSGATIPEAIGAVTRTPAKMLGLEKTKGCLEHDADADLVVLSEERRPDGTIALKADQVWKFGSLVYENEASKRDSGIGC